MVKALFPGSFDPVTFGHLDLVSRACRLFDELVIGVGANPAKQALLEVDERIQSLREVLAAEGLDAEVVSFSGLLVDAAREHDVDVVVRGIRNATDADYEYSMSTTNRTLHADLDTVFLMPSAQWSFLSSRFVREVARAGGDVTPFVPDPVARILEPRARERSS